MAELSESDPLSLDSESDDESDELKTPMSLWKDIGSLFSTGIDPIEFVCWDKERGWSIFISIGILFPVIADDDDDDDGNGSSSKPISGILGKVDWTLLACQIGAFCCSGLLFCRFDGEPGSGECLWEVLSKRNFLIKKLLLIKNAFQTYL